MREEMRRSASLVSERVASSEVESSDSATTVNDLRDLLVPTVDTG